MPRYRERAYIRKVRKYFSLISKNRDDNFAGSHFRSLGTQETVLISATRRDAIHIDVPSRENDGAKLYRCRSDG